MLTVTEATAVNVVLEALLSQRQLLDGLGVPREPEQMKRLTEAAALLASHAHKTLLAGVTSDDVRRWLTKVGKKDVRLTRATAGQI